MERISLTGVMLRIVSMKMDSVEVDDNTAAVVLEGLLLS